MDIAAILAVIALIAATNERITEVLKGQVAPQLKGLKENTRKSVVITLSCLVGVAVAFFMQDSVYAVLPVALQTWQSLVGCGLISASGAGFINSLLEVMKMLPNKKKD